MHDIINPNEDIYDSNEEERNIHDQLNLGQSVPIHLPCDSWFGLTNNDQYAWKDISHSGKVSSFRLLNTSSPSQTSNSGPPQRTTQKVCFRDNKLSKPRAANMIQLDKFISLYHTFFEGGTDTNAEDHINKDELSSNTEPLAEQDQLYAMLTKGKKLSKVNKYQVILIVYAPKLMEKAAFWAQ